MDPGYLSVAVSLLGNVYQSCATDGMQDWCSVGTEFAGGFDDSRGFNTGSLGGRQTLHFYPHGFQILAQEKPLAAALKFPRWW